ncbi:MAG: hypothetical protein ACJ79S_08280 [Gemmatimonadaceae bacterium]
MSAVPVAVVGAAARRGAGSAARVAAVALALAVSLAPAARAVGQAPAAARRPRVELRGDVIAGRTTHAQLALGANAPLGNYVRVDALAGAGSASRGGETRFGARGDLLARFLLDPFRQSRWGPYGGGGVSAIFVDGGGWHGYVVALVGLEGAPLRGLLPALEVGLGGGTRVGLVLRRAPAEGR